MDLKQFIIPEEITLQKEILSEINVIQKLDELGLVAHENPEILYLKDLGEIKKLKYQLLNKNDYPALFASVDLIVNGFAEYVIYHKKSSHRDVQVLQTNHGMILLIDGKLDTFLESEKEFKVTVGHELGHCIACHNQNNIINTFFGIYNDSGINQTREMKSFYKTRDFLNVYDKAIILFQLNEFTADRIGLLASHEFETSVFSNFENIREVKKRGSRDIKKILDDSNQFFNTHQFDFEAFDQTHSYPQLRVKALEMFYTHRAFKTRTPDDINDFHRLFSKNLNRFVPVDLLK